MFKFRRKILAMYGMYLKQLCWRVLFSVLVWFAVSKPLVGFAFANGVGLGVHCGCMVSCMISLCVGLGLGQPLVGWMGRFSVWGGVEPELQLKRMLAFCSWNFCCGWGGLCSCMVLCLVSLCVGLGLGQELVGWMG